MAAFGQLVTGGSPQPGPASPTPYPNRLKGWVYFILGCPHVHGSVGLDIGLAIATKKGGVYVATFDFLPALGAGDPRDGKGCVSPFDFFLALGVGDPQDGRSYVTSLPTLGPARR